jgi:hypothetical protein
MLTAKDAGPLDEHKDKERQAAQLRDKLVHTLQQLDERWHASLTLEYQMRQHPLPFIAAAAGVIIVSAGGITLLILKLQQRHSLRYRVKRQLAALVDAI